MTEPLTTTQLVDEAARILGKAILAGSHTDEGQIGLTLDEATHVAQALAQIAIARILLDRR